MNAVGACFRILPQRRSTPDVPLRSFRIAAHPPRYEYRPRGLRRLRPVCNRFYPLAQIADAEVRLHVPGRRLPHSVRS